MSNIKKLMMSAAGGAGLDVDEVFSTYVYTGNSGSQTFVNGLDLAGEGGLVWSKRRNGDSPNILIDSERNAGSYAKILNSDNANGETTEYGYNWAFNSDGYSLNTTSAEINDTPNREYCSWSFRKAPKFFDVVTYSGNSTAGRTVSHNLGATPAWIFVKCRNSPEAWSVYYGDNTKDLRLDQALAAAATSNWNNTSPTSSNFTLGSNSEVNGTNNTYVAYLFANNNGDGEFGPSGDQDIIKCGQFTTGGQTNEEINLGFEAQFVLIKAISGPYNWETYDIMRGMGLSSSTDTRGVRLQPNRSDSENSSDYRVGAWESGFKFSAGINGTTYTYIAIRRGSLFPPDSATDVFAIDTQGGTSPSPPAFTSGFPVDMSMIRININSGNQPIWLGSRLNFGQYIQTDSNTTEFSNDTYFSYDYNDGVGNPSAAQSSYYSWMWKRAPGYFDVVAYKGDATAGRTISHNLGVAPEMMWVKKRNGTANWIAYHKDLGNNAIIYPNLTNGSFTTTDYWNSTTPTESVFTLGGNNNVNGYNDTFIAYLFATLDGISKVGSYTGNSSTQTIDCGFTGGARFVLIKKNEDGENWEFFDVDRGITSNATDKVVTLSAAFQQYSETDWYGGNAIQPHTSGFQVVNPYNLNISGKQYIFYAIA
jgi:hypothetical protein